MKEHVRIRQEYASLVRARKLYEAQKILEIIWGRKCSNSADSVDMVPKKNKNKQSVVKENAIKFNSFDDLSKIKGIGKKTVEDIKVMFRSMFSLKKALKKNRVGLRDDIVKKLKEELIE